MINWLYFPKSSKPPTLAYDVVSCFEKVSDEIDSLKHKHNSNKVLSIVSLGLQGKGFKVESGKKKVDKISIPVLFGVNGRLEKYFDADAYHEEEGFVVEVEAGRGVINNQFLKDLFQACMMHDVNVLSIAVRNRYGEFKDFEIVCRFFETLYVSNRIKLPLKGILVIGY